LILLFALPASAQKKDTAAATMAVQDAAKKGFPLTTSSTDVTHSFRGSRADSGQDSQNRLRHSDANPA
jgi:hypothetical protein